MPPDDPSLQNFTPIKEQPKPTTNGTKPKKERKLTAAISGSSIENRQISCNYSTTAIAWKELKTGDTFSRSADGKVVYLRTSKNMAHALDKGIEPMKVPLDAQNLEVFRVWINTF